MRPQKVRSAVPCWREVPVLYDADGLAATADQRSSGVGLKSTEAAVR